MKGRRYAAAPVPAHGHRLFLDGDRLPSGDHLNIQLRGPQYSVFAIQVGMSCPRTTSASSRLCLAPTASIEVPSNRIDIADVESSAQAVEAACKTFEALYGAPWKLHADSIDVLADPQ